MKKLILIAVSALAVFSCTKSDKVYMESEIGINPVSQLSPKGAAINGTEYPVDGHFAVWAWKVEQKAGFNYKNDEPTEVWFEKIEFANNGENLWKGVPSQYWPKTGSLFFAAVHPVDVKDLCSYSYGEANLTVENFRQDAGTYSYDVDKNTMYDLMYTDVNETKSSSINNVVRVFHHALSWITVNVKTTEAAKEAYQITSLTIEHVVPQGTFNSNTKTWDLPTTDYSNYTLSTDYAAAPLTTTAVKFDNALLIPQTLSDDNQLVIKFRQKRAQGGAIDSEEQTYKFNLKNWTNDSEWKVNAHYTYNITFNINEILIDPEVQNWADGGTIDLPTIE